MTVAHSSCELLTFKIWPIADAGGGILNLTNGWC
jgi:hypothetical protein